MKCYALRINYRKKISFKFIDLADSFELFRSVYQITKI